MANGPRNAGENADGFRVYRWAGGNTDLNLRYGAVEPADLLSVTSIKTLAGENFKLVNWKISNVVNVATGSRKVTRVGPRGGIKEVNVQDGEFPGEFIRRILAEPGKIDEHRRWLRDNADMPRDVAAVRGSVVHKMIEDNLPLRVLDEDVIRKRFALQWAGEKRKVKPAILDDDVYFVWNAMRQYEDMRENVPFVVLAQEPQVFNLRAGYAGSADVLIWFLGHWDEAGVFVPLPGVDVAYWQKEADAKRVTKAIVEEVGGTLGVGDWKTAKSILTSHVIQTIAYMSGEFIAVDGIIDERLTELLQATMAGMLIHVRPNAWGVSLFDFEDRQDALRAFLGSVAYARFLAVHPDPSELFFTTMQGTAPDTEPSQEFADESI